MERTIKKGDRVRVKSPPPLEGQTTKVWRVDHGIQGVPNQYTVYGVYLADGLHWLDGDEIELVE